MMAAFGYRENVDIGRNRRACAMPDLPHGRAFCNNRFEGFACTPWHGGPASCHTLPRSGMAQAASIKGDGHA